MRRFCRVFQLPALPPSISCQGFRRLSTRFPGSIIIQKSGCSVLMSSVIRIIKRRIRIPSFRSYPKEMRYSPLSLPPTSRQKNGALSSALQPHPRSLIASVSMGGSLPSKGGPIGYLKSINRSSLDSRICLTLDSFRSPSCRKVKAVVRPYPGAGLSQNIAFRAAFGIAYTPVPRFLHLSEGALPSAPTAGSPWLPRSLHVKLDAA